MKITKSLLFSILALISFSCKSQPETPAGDYYVGYYKITPAKKQVEYYEMIGGVNWDGYHYVKDPKISFDSTVLVIIGDEAYFKEYLPTDMNTDALRLISDGQNAYLIDGRSVYMFDENRNDNFKKIDISGLKEITAYLFQDADGKLFFLDNDEFQLTPLDLKGIDTCLLYTSPSPRD